MIYLNLSDRMLVLISATATAAVPASCNAAWALRGIDRGPMYEYCEC